MGVRNSAAVGLTVLVAAALLVVATFSLRGVWLGRGWYEQKVAFPNAQGIQKGAAVRVQGVEMGSVADVRLGERAQALLTLRVKDSYRIQPDDAIRIVGGLLGFSPPYVEITPGGRTTAASGTTTDVLQGETSASPDRLVDRSTQLIESMNRMAERMSRMAESLNATVNDPQLRGGLTRTVRNFETMSQTGVRVAANMERASSRGDRLIARFESTATGLDRTLRQADRVMGEFRGAAGESRALMKDARTLVGETRETVQDTRQVVRQSGTIIQGAGFSLNAAVAENRERLRVFFENLNGSVKRLDATLEEAKSLVGDPETKANLKDATANLRAASDNLKAISSDVRGVTGDPKVQEDLKATIVGLRDASREAAETFRRVRGVIDRGGEKIQDVRQRLSDTEISATGVGKVRSGRTRFDLDATVPWGDSTFFRAGLYNFGNDTRFNLQGGQEIRPGIWGRYGLHASRLGLGLDVGNRLHPWLSLDLYGVDRTRLDVRGNVPLTSSLDLTLGLDNSFRSADPVIGLRYRH